MITITGLGPGALDRVPGPVRDLLLDEDRTVIVRTLRHPAASELAALRQVVTCDDLYESYEAFPDVYAAIAGRVLEAAASGPVVYAVPGSPVIGEFAVRRIMEQAPDAELIPSESFVDAVLAAVGYDPLDRGLQILNGHSLPDPLVLDKPTIIGHLDRPEILADVLDAVARVTIEEATVTLLAGAGSPDAVIVTATSREIDHALAGPRTTLFVDATPGGLLGAVQVMRRLREECPWDREQTHQTLVKNLLEECYELIDAIGRLPEEGIDWVAYSAVEDELGDVLLQVLFHEAIAREVGAFDIDGVAEVLRQKLVRRHPHVFGDVEVADAGDVKRNWDLIKEGENGPSDSSLDGVPAGLPGLQRAAKIQNRAAKVGFDWEEAGQVLPKVREEVSELESAMSGDGDIAAELGDVLFSVVNLSRHLGVDPELALRAATSRFEERFRTMEGDGPLTGLDLDELNRRWDSAKGR
ncbi:MAG TPA: nucleoside triphosphate pyrophosphohydrolase [Acidimicrobiia bacterium]|nr:nucleoside triphosphate pyrophosphohydrolase [Acidimicrobiia bacterium]